MKKLQAFFANPTVRHMLHFVVVAALIREGVLTPNQAAALPPLASAQVSGAVS